MAINQSINKSLPLGKFKLIIPLALSVCYFTNNTTASIFVHSDDKNTLEFISSPTIRTVKTHKLGWELADPVIELNGNDRVVLTFDDISNTPGNYSYSIIHCDSEWNPSNLFINDYMDGFEVNEIRDYSFSTGTTSSYTHYRLELPNRDVRMRISGNYLIRVFDTYSPDEIILQRRFLVYEPLVNITASIRQPSAGEFRFTGQQVELLLNTARLRITDPFAEVKAVVCQNHLFQGCHEDIKPAFVRGEVLDYSQPNALIFEGGNEYRLFDSKSIRYNGQGIQSISYYGGEFHIQLNEDQDRRSTRYTFYPDLNGRFVVNLERSSQSHIEADYAWTYFTLRTPMEVDEGKSVHLFGELTGWEISPQNRMLFNPARNAYETRLLLKQGAYNYRYLVVDNSTGEVDATHFEGSYFDTENSYTILVYYKPLGARYHRLTGYKKISTSR